MYKIMKLLKYFSLITISCLPLTAAVLTNTNTNNTNHNIVKVNLNSGQVDPDLTEEQKKVAEQQFWIEFGITAGVLGLIIIIGLIILFIKKRKK